MEIVLQFIKLFGGLGMFLYGMNAMSSSLERLAGNRMQKWMEKVAGNLFTSVLLGLGVTALIQSSSATTVMVVGFVSAGVLSLKQATGIIMGANIGTTVTAWLISLNDVTGTGFLLELIKPTTFAPIALIIGAVLLMFAKSVRKKGFGEMLTGLGVLFIGMEYMSASMEVVFETVPALGQLFAKEWNPFVGVLVGAIITAVIQSSSASVGMLQAVASTGMLRFHGAFSIIMGQNIGTCITAVLSAIGGSRDAKRTAAIHLYFNLIGTAIFMTVILLSQYWMGLPFWNNQISAVDISVFHSLFNLTTTFLLLPFANVLVKLAKKTVKEKENPEDVRFSLLSDRFYQTPAVAVSNAKRVLVDMGQLALENVQNCHLQLTGFSRKREETALQNEELLDRYEIELTNSFTRISELSLSEEDAVHASSYLRMVTNIERIGDYCDNIMKEIALMKDDSRSFTEKGQKEMETMFRALEEICQLTIAALNENRTDLATRIEPLEEVIDGLQEMMESRHMVRLKEKECSVEGGVSYLDIISNAERIADHCSNIAVAILQTKPEAGVDNRHSYLREVHATMPGSYKETYEGYQKKYAI